jgi:glycosyltransferase involved in cell wall biosynthesis
MDIVKYDEFKSLASLMQDIAILVLTYNQESILSECLDSILSQEIKGKTMRIFVIDDASTDGTPKLISKYEARYPDIIFPILYKSGWLGTRIPSNFQLGGRVSCFLRW